MRIDAALLDRAIRESISRPVVRIYRWDGPSLSVGAHQHLSDELANRCRDLGVDVVRRPTGGSAVVHGNDLTYSVVAPHGGLGVLKVYREVAEALIDGLALMGINACIGIRRPGPSPYRPAELPLEARSSCFATTVGADLRVGEAKICGSAQFRRRGWFLQHGSIPMTDDRELTRRLLRHPGTSHSTCIEHLRPGTPVEELSACLIEGFENRWGKAREITLDHASTSSKGAAERSDQSTACLTL